MRFLKILDGVGETFAELDSNSNSRPRGPEPRIIAKLDHNPLKDWINLFLKKDIDSDNSWMLMNNLCCLEVMAEYIREEFFTG